MPQKILSMSSFPTSTVLRRLMRLRLTEACPPPSPLLLQLMSILKQLTTSTAATRRGSRLWRATIKTSGLDAPSFRRVGQSGSKDSLLYTKEVQGILHKLNYYLLIAVFFQVKKNDFVQCEGCEWWFHLTYYFILEKI